MGSFNRDDRSAGGSRGGFSRGGGSRGGFGGPRRESGFRSGGFNRGNDRGDRPMYTAICSNCGKECQVPFRPTNGKPVYCSDCFEKMGRGRPDAGKQDRSDFRPQAPVSNQGGIQLDAVNAKLDRILKLLEPKVSTPAVLSPTVEKAVDEIKEVIIPKTKKVAKKSASTKKK